MTKLPIQNRLLCDDIVAAFNKIGVEFDGINLQVESDGEVTFYHDINEEEQIGISVTPSAKLVGTWVKVCADQSKADTKTAKLKDVPAAVKFFQQYNKKEQVHA